jgi:hypothetical protein
MISRTFGAPFAGLIRGDQYGFDFGAVSLITPPNFAGGGGSWSPWTVVVALGDPGVPLIFWALASPGMSADASINTADHLLTNPLIAASPESARSF